MKATAIIDLKKRVRERDGMRCVDCGMTDDEHRGHFRRGLDVHRLKENSRYTFAGSVTLCACCHQARHGARQFRIAKGRPVIGFNLDQETYREARIAAATQGMSLVKFAWQAVIAGARKINWEAEK